MNTDVILMHILTQGEYFLRIIIAGICGVMIGYERKNRLKEAGVRTHLIVAVGAALMMVVSKYGFADVLIEGGRADASRIASQIVTGVGFLGAGTIFVRKQVISGLTTAAGIWTTAGIGMAVGAGMYSVGIATAVVIVAVQMILRGNVGFLRAPSAEHISLRVKNTSDAVTEIYEALGEHKIEVISIVSERVSDEYSNIELFVKFPADFKKEEMSKILIEKGNIKTFEY